MTKKFALTLWYRYSLYERMKDLERKRDLITVDDRQQLNDANKK